MGKAEEDRAYMLVMFGIAAEKDKDIDGAVMFYEEAVDLAFDGSHPYDRLAVLYRKAKRPADEARVLMRAITVFENVPDERGDKVPKLERFRERLRKLEGMK